MKKFLFLLVATVSLVAAPALTHGATITLVPAVPGFAGTDGVFLHLPGFDDGTGFISGGPQSGFAEFFIDGISVPVGSTITSATLRWGTTDLFGTGDHVVTSYDSVTAPLSADGIVVPPDFGTPTTLVGSFAGGGGGLPIDHSFTVTSFVETALATGGVGAPTTATGFLAFRWDPDPLSPAFGTISTGLHGSSIDFPPGFGAPALFIDFTVPNIPPTAVLIDPADFSSGSLSTTLDGGLSTDNGPAPDSITNYAFTPSGELVINSAASTTPLSLAASGLTQPGDTNTISLVVTDSGGPDVSTNLAEQTVTYTNQTPTASVGSITGIFDASSLAGDSVTANGNVDDPDLIANGAVSSFEVLSYTWQDQFNNALGGGSTGAAETDPGNDGVPVSTSVTFAQAVAAGMVNTVTPGVVDLAVADNNAPGAGGAASDTSGSLLINYTNTATSIDNATTSGVGGIQFDVVYDDADLDVNGAAPNNFEVVDWEFNTESDGSGVNLGSGSANNQDDFATGNFAGIFLSDLDLMNLGFGPGDHELFFLFDDLAGGGLDGNSDPFISLGFSIAGIPEPATIAIWTMLGLCVGGYVVRRKKKA